LEPGFCAGVPEVSIHGTVHQVKAEIRKIDSFSGHGDYREMIDFLKLPG
jgi:metallo-beta-lactamase family protein